MPWQVIVDPAWPDADDVPHRLALDVDPRRRVVSLGPQVVGSGSLDIQAGAVARSFYEGPGSETASDLSGAEAWLQGPEAAALLVTIEAGYHCDVLWTGDPVVTWSEAAWAAGNALMRGVGERVPG